MPKLILVRHGESQWNRLGKWTGWTDIELTDNGRHEARKAAAKIGTNTVHAAFSSPLARAFETMQILLEGTAAESSRFHKNDALKERNYGDFTGKNKNEVKSLVGNEEFLKIRRSWDYPIQNGETLKDVYERVKPFHESHIVKRLQHGENVLIVAHGNTLRAYIKHLESIKDQDIGSLELGTAEVREYTFDKNLQITDKKTYTVGAVH